MRTQSVIDPLPSCPGALSIAAKFFDTENHLVYCDARGSRCKCDVIGI